MGTSISLTAILPRVGKDDLARVVIMVNGEKGLLFSIVSVGHDNRVQGVVVKFGRGFINKVNVRITHKFEFCQAQCLFSDGAMDGILFGRREAVREEGDEFHCQICGAPKDCGLQCFMEEDNGIFLVLLGYFNMDSAHCLALG